MVSRFLQLRKNRPTYTVAREVDLVYANIGLITLGLLFTVVFIVGHVTHILPFPFWDGVSVAHFLDQPRVGLMSHISAAITFGDNEHRPIFPMIFWILDRSLFDGPGPFTLTVMFVLCLAICLMLASLFQRQTSSIGYAAVLAAVAAMIYSPGHFENLIWWKQLHVYMACGAALASLYLAAKVDTSKEATLDRRAAASVALALVASFSFGYGLLVWPLLVGHALFARWRRGEWLILITGIATLTLFLAAFPTAPTPAHGSVLENLMNPGAVLAYTLELTGFIARRIMSFIFPGQAAVLTQGFGLVMLLIALTGLVFAYFGNANADTKLRAAVLISGFSIGNALLTGISRVTVNQPTAPRYLIVSAIGIAATAAIVAILASRAKHPAPSAKAVTAALSFIFIIFAVSFLQSGRHGWNYLEDRAARGAVAADLKVTDVYPLLFDARGAKKLDEGVWPNFVIRAHNSGQFLGFGRQGTSLADTFQIAPEPCIGAIDALTASKSRAELFEVTGWARVGSQGQKRAEFVMFTDSNDIVLGVGLVRKNRPDVAARLSSTPGAIKAEQPAMAGFTGLMRTDSFNDLRAYATRGKSACRLKVGPIHPKP